MSNLMPDASIAEYVNNNNRNQSIPVNKKAQAN